MLQSLTVVSRAEFLPANLGSLIAGLAWGIDQPFGLSGDIILRVFLTFAIITVISAFGAQINTICDYELDSKDPRKKSLVEAVRRLEASKIKWAMMIEFSLGLVLLAVLFLIQPKPVLLFLYAAGVFFAYAYSAPPLRLKSRSWFAVGAILLALCFLPILFVFYSFASELDPIFLLFLVGQALMVYAIIIPAEIRDYFGDKELGVETMTIRLGLAKASLLGIVLLSAGGLLAGTAFFLRFISGPEPLLGGFLIAIIVSDYLVLREYRKLYLLSKQYEPSGRSSIAEEIVSLSAHNPEWITLVSQSHALLNVVLFIGKSLF